VFGSIATGLMAGVVIGWSSEYYTSVEYRPTRWLADQARTGAATTIIAGLAQGMLSSWAAITTVSVATLLAYAFAGGFHTPEMGLYGIGIAAVSMLSPLGITLASDAFGSIADNAGGNAEMTHQPHEVRERTDALDALGNTTAATGKGFAIGSAALTALALLAAFVQEVRAGIQRQAATQGLEGKLGSIPVEDATLADFMQFYQVNLLNPRFLVGMFIGVLMVFLFCGLTMKAVGRAAGQIVDEVRRQFRELNLLTDTNARADYARCVSIATAASLREMVLPALLAVAAPIAVGLLLNVSGVMGLLAGALTAGFATAVFMANAGGAWDNAKKYIEAGHHGGKGSPAHKAAVVGDTVGDPFKDTSGPSLNILIKLMSMVAIVFAGIIVTYAPQIARALGLGD
jgi:K(+)-stimulated pyrophosphate-energized sodium pump